MQLIPLSLLRMTIQLAFQHFTQQITSIYGDRESQNILRIVFEDVFAVRNLQRQDELSQEQLDQLNRICQRLKQGEPIQYILGEADFYGLKIKVAPGVLIPRPETEELVWWIRSAVVNPQKILDVGTGSACIPLALKKCFPEAEIHAIDVSESALKVAEANSKHLDLPIHFHQLDILQKESWSRLGHFDLIVSNPPYIPPSEKQFMPTQVLQHEPELALLVPEEDPLLFYRTIGSFAQTHLLENGHLFFELNEFLAEKTQLLLEQLGFSEAEIREDMQGKDRMLWLRK